MHEPVVFFACSHCVLASGARRLFAHVGRHLPSSVRLMQTCAFEYVSPSAVIFLAVADTWKDASQSIAFLFLLMSVGLTSTSSVLIVPFTSPLSPHSLLPS